MVTRALHDSGLHLIGSDAEQFIDAAEDNPEGFWENKAIVACNDELLEATGGAWDNPPSAMPLALDDPRVAHIADSSAAAIAALSEYDHWGFKDPRTCLTAAYWLDLVPDLHFVICVRHPLEVALSLKRRNQNSYSLGLRLWERYYATVLELVPVDRRILTHYDTFFLDPREELARLCAFAGLKPATPRVRSDLRHHTIGVGLDDAGVSENLRRLYDALCREAGAPVLSEPPSDEGRVRRLILDGAVATRHAEQRQDAIDRLHEREEEARADRAAAEAELRARVRDLELELGRSRRDAATQLANQRIAAEVELRERVGQAEARTAAARDEARAMHDATIAAIRALGDTFARSESKLADIDRQIRGTSGRVDQVITALQPGPVRKAAKRSAGKAVRGSKRVARGGKRVARGAVKQLPPEAQQTLRRGRGLIRRARTDPGPTAETVARKLAPKARSAAKRLPPSAQQSLRRADRLYRSARAEPLPTAKRVAGRLPPPAQDVLRRTRRSVVRAQRATRPPAVRPAAVKPPPAPKGPPLRQWKAQYETMVADAVPAESQWLAVIAGSPKEVCDARTPRATPFPQSRHGFSPSDDLALIAQLEALLFAGHRYLVLPEGSRPWFQRAAELRDHVARKFRTVVDEPGAGAVFDLSTPAATGVRSLRGEVKRLATAGASVPAVLDWTGLDVAGELRDLTVFRPPDGSQLPYLDRSIDVVVVDTEHDLSEARRVASVGVIVVAARGTSIDVRAVEGGGEEPAAAPRTLVWSSSSNPNDGWRGALEARATAAGVDVWFASIEAASLPAGKDYDVIVAVEEGVLPLPGSIEAAARAAICRPDTAIAGKVLRGDGRLEAAGGSVFFDRSLALIAGSTTEVRAPWHEYARPVCWAPGIIAAPAALWASIPGPDKLTGRAFIREWCARIWEDGGSVMYRPEVTAVRVRGDGGEASIPLHESAWQRVLDLRPTRPNDLSDGAWRYLLAHDDVEACRA